MAIGFDRFARTAILAVALVSGCGEVAPLGRRPESPRFLTPARLAAMVPTGASRDRVEQQFGEPYAASPKGNALAYLRTETVDRSILTMAVIVPFWSTASITYFQVVGLWFDADGHVARTRLWDGHDGPHGGNPYQTYHVPSPEQAVRWLESAVPSALDPPTTTTPPR